jgi:hypothetical protein
MRPTLLFGFAVCVLSGCQSVGPTEDPTVVHAQQQRIIVEGQAAAQGVTALPPTPLAAPGIPLAAPMNVSVRDRTGFGLVLDCIKIPIPFLRPVAVPRPAEVTYQVPTPGAGFGLSAGIGFGAQGIPLGAGVPLGGGVPLAAGMPFGAGYPMAAGMPMAAGYAGYPPGPQGLTPQQQALLVQALAAQAANGNGKDPSNSSQGTEESVEEKLRKCEEALKKLEEAKKKNGG